MQLGVTVKTITKASIKRLNRYQRIPRIRVLGTALASACAIYEESKVAITGEIIYRYSRADDTLAEYTSNVALISSIWDRRYIEGMRSRFPDFIQTVFTHGNNEMKFIGDPNKLIRLILTEELQ